MFNGNQTTSAPPVPASQRLPRPPGRVTEVLVEHGRLALLLGRTFRRMLLPPYDLRELARQMDYLGMNSLAIALMTALFTGMVMALQFAVSLDRFGGREYVAVAVAVALVRELGPVLTAVVVGGRVGSGIAAELGSMAVTEQIDAIRALGADPVKKLVVPRMAAMLIVLPLLTFLADCVGILGGMIIAGASLGIPPRTYLADSVHGIMLADFLSGIIKSFVFAVGITLVACNQGMKTTGGTQGVGESTTLTVVVSLIFIFIADFFLTKLMMGA